MSTRKRKAEDDIPDRDRMSFSPSPTPTSAPQRPSTSNKASSPTRVIKRARTNVTGRPLALPRLLETLSYEEMRQVLESICERHLEIATEIEQTAPRPSVESALTVLRRYQTILREAFPYGDKATSEYAFNRVRPSLTALIDTLNDFTPHFLPPNESQTATSLSYLNAATTIIHELPNWDTYLHNRYKQEAYEDIAKAWACVIREAAKRGGGIQMQVGGWDQKLIRHDEESGGRLREAVAELRSSCSWIGGGMSTGMADGNSSDAMSIRQQLLSGTYGVQSPIQVGPW